MSIRTAPEASSSSSSSSSSRVVALSAAPAACAASIAPVVHSAPVVHPAPSAQGATGLASLAGLTGLAGLAGLPGLACTDRDLLDAYLDRGITDIVSVPCSITDTWHSLAAEETRRGRANLVMSSHEGNLPGIAGGIYLGTGRPALVHMQNSGLPNAGDGSISFADPEVLGIPMAVMVTFRGATPADDSEPHQAIGRRTDALCDAIFGADGCVFGDRHGRALLALTDELVEHRTIRAEAWRMHATTLPRKELVDLVSLVAQYVFFALMNNAFQVEVEPSLDAVRELAP